MTTTAARRPAASIRLRDYQEEARDAVHEARGRGVRRQILSLPTGSGKTVLAAHLAAEYLAETDDARVLFQVHRDELAEQTERTFAQVVPGLDIGRVKAERDDLDAEVLVVSAQTLARPARLDRLAAAVAGQRVIFISDEAHHDRAPSRMRTIQTINPDLLLGLTATPHRGDRLGLDAIYDEIVAHVPMLDLMRQGRLARLRGLRIETTADLDVVHLRAGEFVERELAEALNVEGRNRLIVESWKKYAPDRTRTVVFAVDVAHAYALRDTFRAAGVRAEAILGETPADERRAILDDFASGDLPVLTNVAVLTEGYDEPGIDCVLMARPTKSAGLYQQMAGRAARTSPETGKQDALIVDFCDNTARHTLVAFPSLAGEEIAEGDAATEPGQVVDLLEHAEQQAAIRERRAVEVDLFGASPLVWQRSDELRFARAGTDAAANRWVAVVRQGEVYVPYVVTKPKARQAPAVVEALSAQPLDLDLALGVAGDAVERSPLTDRRADWRRRKDAPSPQQVKFARQLGVRDTKGMTKAQLSEEIDRVLFLQAAQQVGLAGMAAHLEGMDR